MANKIKRRREKTQICKIRSEKGEIPKSRDSSGIISRNYIPINWKILKK
jgi:hypothetical protein